MKSSKVSMLRNVLSGITVEPAIFLFVLAGELSGTTLLAFIYYKACINRFSNDTSICPNLHNETYKAEEDLVQTDSSHWLIYIYYFTNIPCIFMTIIYGIISDAYSQKAVIAMPLIMCGMQSLVFILMSLFPSAPSELFLLASFFMGLGGGWATFFSQALAYVACVTSEEKRTERIAIANGMYNIAAIIAFSSGGVLLDHTSFTFVFCTCFILNAIGAMYTYIRIENVIVKSNKWSYSSFCKNIMFDFKDSIKIVTRKRPHNKRCQIIALLSIAALLLFGNSRKYIIIVNHSKVHFLHIL